MPKLLIAFDREQSDKAYRLLAARVAHMGERKFEEGDWADVYCGAKGLPVGTWSNLNIDINANGLGVEQKMLRVRSNQEMSFYCSNTYMHPSATRSLRISDTKADPEAVMKAVFEQYRLLIEERTKTVLGNAKGAEPDMRTGWLLWQDSLRQFLYFEERMEAPDPAKHRAVWVETRAKGARKASRSLWIYEKDTGKKRYSVTTEAGIKIQPYFDVPAVDDPAVFIFTVQGLPIEGGLVRVWLTKATASELERIVGSLDEHILSKAILDADLTASAEALQIEREAVTDVVVKHEAYAQLTAQLSGKSDEVLFRTLVSYLRAQA
jgi:hypothetical protein